MRAGMARDHIRGIFPVFRGKIIWRGFKIIVILIKLHMIGTGFLI